MDICLEMVIAYLFLFLAFTVDLEEAQSACGHCEGKGMRCMTSNSSGWGTECYIPIQTKGILSIRLINTFLIKVKAMCFAKAFN